MENFLFDAIACLAKAGFEELKKGADIFAVEDIQFKVSSKQHLVKAKKLIENKRNQDMYDIQMLEELLHETGKR